MLEGGDSKPLESHSSISSLVALKPRQVLLAEQKQQLKKYQPRLIMAKKQLKGQQLSQKNHILNDDHKLALLHSVIKYISDKGFAKTFKRVLQEAQVEDDLWKVNSFDLEDIYCKYLENCRNGDTNSTSVKEQEEIANGTLLKYAGGDKDVSLETRNNNKKKKNSGNDGNAKSSVSEVKTDDPIVELKDKRKKKQKESAYETMVKAAVHDEDASVVIDGKKKKKKNEENDENAKSSVSGVKKDVSTEEDTDKKKMKKIKLVSESCDENGTQENSLPAVTEQSVVDRGADATDISLASSKNEPIEKKRKKKVSVSEKLSDNGMEVVGKEKLLDTVDNGTANKSKKRKRSASDESKDKHVEGVVAEESKKRKTGGPEEAEINAQQAEAETVHGGETKEDNDSVSLMKPRKPSVKQIDESEKGNLVNNGVGRSSEKKIVKHHNGSAEPKTVNAFQRVKVDEVEFADERLQDNSYWAKGGAENGYGAKAQEVLGQVKGRGFRHEKTKKKRGSYRGGLIDLQSHSVKFKYADDE